MRTLLLDVVQDLRTKRLLPVAALLAVVVVAAPILILRGGPEEPVPADEVAVGDARFPQLVEPTDAALAGSSRLNRFEPKDPFVPGSGLIPPPEEVVRDPPLTDLDGGGALSPTSRRIRRPGSRVMEASRWRTW